MYLYVVNCGGTPSATLTPASITTTTTLLLSRVGYQTKKKKQLVKNLTKKTTNLK
jgi:hypothetical protein